MNNISKIEYIKKNITKEWLRSNGFHYNRLFSDNETEVYTYRFPVLKYERLTSLECELRASPNDNKIIVNVYDYNTNSRYAPFYYCEYSNFDNVLKEIHNKIDKKLNDLGIKRRERMDRYYDIVYIMLSTFGLILFQILIFTALIFFIHCFIEIKRNRTIILKEDKRE